MPKALNIVHFEAGHIHLMMNEISNPFRSCINENSQRSCVEWKYMQSKYLSHILFFVSMTQTTVVYKYISMR